MEDIVATEKKEKEKESSSTGGNNFFGFGAGMMIMSEPDPEEEEECADDTISKNVYQEQLYPLYVGEALQHHLTRVCTISSHNIIPINLWYHRCAHQNCLIPQ